MKLFFTASYNGHDKFLWAYNKIYSTLVTRGDQMLDDDIIETSYKTFIQEIEKDKLKYRKIFSNKMTLVEKADVCIFEVSNRSIGVGFLIQRAIEKNKPTLVLYQKGYKSYFLESLDVDYLTVREYTKNNLTKVLMDSVKKIMKTKESRFNFYANPKLMAFIEKKSKDKGISQSAFIRGLLLDEFRKEQDTTAVVSNDTGAKSNPNTRL